MTSLKSSNCVYDYSTRYAVLPSHQAHKCWVGEIRSGENRRVINCDWFISPECISEAIAPGVLGVKPSMKYTQLGPVPAPSAQKRLRFRLNVFPLEASGMRKEDVSTKVSILDRTRSQFIQEYGCRETAETDPISHDWSVMDFGAFVFLTETEWVGSIHQSPKESTWWWEMNVHSHLWFRDS